MFGKRERKIAISCHAGYGCWWYAHNIRIILTAIGMLAFSAQVGHAGTPISLYRTFAGNLNYVTTGGTLRTSGSNACAVTNGPVSASLTGTDGTTIRAAYLYWAGSYSTQAGSTSTAPDYNVTFNGNTVTADRTFTDTRVSGGTNYDFFSGFKDVTPYVTGDGTYTFSNLSVNSGTPHCGLAVVLSGWALVVIYQDTSEPLRVVNIYDGFQNFHDSSITLSPNNFRIPATGIDGKHTHITWEGDVENSNCGSFYCEDFRFNSVSLTDSYNPANSQFNSTINTLPTITSYGVDIDTFDVSSYLSPGAGSASTIYSSGGDTVLLNAEVLSVTNTAVADLSITKSHNGNFPTGGTGTFQLAVLNNGPSTATGTVGSPIVVTDTIPAGLSYSSSSGSGWTVDTSSLPTVRWRYVGTAASGVPLPPISLQVTVSAAVGATITNSASVSGPDFDHDLSNNDSSDTVNVTFSAGSGNKPLYLYGSGDGYKLSRIPTPGNPALVRVAESSSRTWSLNPVLQLASTINPSVSTSVPVALYLARTGSTATGRTVNVTLSCSSGGANLSQSQSLSFGNTNPTLINFSLPLASAQTCPAGSSWMLTVTNSSSGSGARDINVYPVYGGNISQVTLPTTTVIDVNSVAFYNAAYPGGSAVSSVAPGNTVYIRATVSDPFGSYDISGATITLTDGIGVVRVNGATMTQIFDSGTATKTYEFSYTVPAGGPSGNWTARVVAAEGTEGTITDDASATLPVIAPPLLTVIKSATPSPSVNPGQVITYTVLVTNSGAGAATSVVAQDQLSPYVSWGINSYGAGLPFQLIDGTPSSGLALGTPVFSSDNGATWTYTPTSGAGGAPAGFDSNVTNWRIPMIGTMNASSANFFVNYQVRVK